MSACEPLWTASEVATFLRVSRSWVYNHAAAGLLPVVRIGSLLRFHPEAIRAYMRGEWAPTSAVAPFPSRGRQRPNRM